MPDNRTTLESIRKRVEHAQGKTYWRSLEELAGSDEFLQAVEKEFPQATQFWDQPFSRRKFMKVMGASLALAGLGGACTRQPEEKIIPYVQPPEEVVPGEPLFFATAMTMGGFANGILAESHMGRPTKIEGNPDHPASLGATDLFAQATVLELYDPDRSQVVTRAGRISTWETFLSAVNGELENHRLTDGARIRVLTETVTSPTLAEQLQNFLSEFPLAKWHQYEPVHRDNTKRGARLAFGQFLETQYDFEKAKLVVSLDADFLVSAPGSLRYARQFTAARKADEEHPEMNRLYVVESTPSLTGTMADHRLSMKASGIGRFAFALAEELGVAKKYGLTLSEDHPPAGGYSEKWIKALARDLKNHRGESTVVASDYQPAEVHFLAHLINAELGNVGTTVFYTSPVEAKPVLQTESIRELAADVENDSVDMLLIIGGNPAFTAPADLHFSERMAKVKFRAHLSLYEDETSNLCHWHIPQAHFLENWSDARTFDGTASIIQPLIAPLYGGKSAHEFLSVFMGQPGKPGYEIVRDYWRRQRPADDFEKFWRTAVHDGVVAGTALVRQNPRLRIENRRLRMGLQAVDGVEINFRADPTIWDGRFANNGWLQECPKPLTKLTWDNAALVSPKTAKSLGLENEQLVELNYQNRTVRAPTWIMPGHPDNSVTVHFGYGRSTVGRVGRETGFNAYALRTSESSWFDSGLEIRSKPEGYKLASTQLHSNMENRQLVRVGTLAEYIAHPEFIHEMGHEPADDLTLYPKFEYNGYAWGMSVDLNSCIGCNACTVACQSENNIPVVGKEEVVKGREMHWIRIDRYYEGDLDQPETLHQPVMCMHCENAPCEVVCPVGATSHSEEGLNEMTYNRCVGTRYCSNNCPYKVRRFNFFEYADFKTPSLKMLRNPDVTVRSRGVMEKCTYCVQRINSARIQAKKEDRNIRDGEILTACQQVCPTDAIVFGNINDPNSRIAKLKASHRNYGILSDLGTRPRTSYLGRIRNPNPEIEKS